MRLDRIVIQNFRVFASLDVNVADDLCCIIGENNTGKTAILRAIQICFDNMLPSSFRSLLREDIHSAIDIAEPSQVLIGIELTGFEGRVLPLPPAPGCPRAACEWRHRTRDADP